MVKKLILVRHSKAENRGSSGNDFERSLTNEGKADSIKMANSLIKAGLKPDFILTSSASRAFETAMIFAEVFNTGEKNILATRKLYYSSAKTILDQIFGLPETIDCVMVVAHNPGISELARGLSSGRPFFMGNTQIIALEYNIEHWYQIDDINPSKCESFKISDIN